MEQIMQMKIVRGVTPIVLLSYLIIREFFFFFSSKFSSSVSQRDHDQHQISFVSQIFVCVKPSYLVVFFTFNIIVVALLVGISTQLSSFSSPSSAEVSILSLIDPFEGLKSTKDEDYEVYNDDFTPQIVYVEYKEEKAEGDHQSYDDHYCHKADEEITITDDHQDHGSHDDQEEQKTEILMSDDDEYCGYDDEDMSEEDVYSELNDDDFNKRIEEFIDENNKKWREELQNERLIYVDRIIS